MRILLALGACTGETTSTDPADPQDTGAWEPPEHEQVEARYSPEEVLATLDAHVAAGLPSPHVSKALYLEFMAEGDETCPADDSQLDDTKVPLSGCWSESGYGYAGIAVLLENSDEAVYGYQLFGDFQLTDPDGEVFEAGGVTGFQAQVDESSRTALVELTGSWVYPPSPHWLGEGYSGTLKIAAREGSGEDRRLNVSGGWQRPDSALYTPELLLDSTVCPEAAPTGTVQLRDPSGGWWTVDFGDACSGCGTLAWADGTEHGEVCPTLSPLLDGVEVLWGT